MACMWKPAERLKRLHASTGSHKCSKVIVLSPQLISSFKKINYVRLSLDTMCFKHIQACLPTFLWPRWLETYYLKGSCGPQSKILAAAMDVQSITTQNCSICRKITKTSNTANSALCWLITHGKAISYWVPSHCLAK